MATPDGYIEIRFGPRWKYISPARIFIQNFIAIALSDQGKADGIAMAASELLENAVKYGASEDTHCIVQAFPETGVIECSVTNQATEKGATEVLALYKKIMSGEPLEAYIVQMREAATRTDGKSQLGLARIRYEIGADIKLVVTPDFKVTFTIIVK
jgi:hypothetical protein